MAESATFTAEPRQRAGKSANREIRRRGKIPAVIYGGDTAPESVAIDLAAVIKSHQTGKMLSRVCEIDLAGKTIRALPREVQVDPVKDEPRHVDFYRLVPGARIAIMIPVEFKNTETSPGIKRGGVLNIVRHEVELMVDADNVPDHLEADLAGLEINDSLHISAMNLPAGAKPTIERDFTVATIAAPSTFTVTEAAEGAAEGEAATEGEAGEGEKKAEEAKK